MYNPKVLISLIEKWMAEGGDDSQEYNDFVEILKSPLPFNEKVKHLRSAMKKKKNEK